MSNQITEDMVLELLCNSVPAYKAIAESELDEEDRESGYSIAGNFADFLLDKFNNGETDILQSAAEFIEELYIRGNENVQELATIGFLEGIQNGWANNKTDPEVYFEYLLPESRKWWNQLNDFWNGEIKTVGETFTQKP